MLCIRQPTDTYIYFCVRAQNNHQPEIEGCGLAEVERAHRQTPHGYIHGVVTCK